MTNLERLREMLQAARNEMLADMSKRELTRHDVGHVDYVTDLLVDLIDAVDEGIDEAKFYGETAR